ncbi:hypothetical protein [Spirosoma sp.]|uniref:hypothetical protein n=1 Tax=Spirosoma sp. TaxID=1899569 RepID=UPI003B3A899A
MNPAIIEAKFRRYKVESEHLLLRRDVTSEIKDVLHSIVEVDLIIIFYRSSTYFWVMTLEKIIIFSEDRWLTALFQDIDKIDPNFLDQTKQNISEMGLLMKSGSLIRLQVEATTWHVVLGILKLLKAQHQ